MADIKIIMPVGTSLLRNWEKSKEYVESLDIDTVRFHRIPLMQEIMKSSPPNYLFNVAKNRDNDRNPAEISSLYAFWLKEKKEGRWPTNAEVDVVLLHAPNPEGKFCAFAVRYLLGEKSYMCTDGTAWSTQLLSITDLDVYNADSFLKSMDALAEIVTRETLGFNGDIFINISGGYKAMGPYLTMMSMALGKRVKVFYLFEKSLEVLCLPTYPLAFDLLEWRDWRSLLLPFSYSGLFTREQQKKYYRGLSGTKVEGLLRAEGNDGLTFNSIGRIMRGFYEAPDSESVTQFGQGHILLDSFTESNEGQKMSSYLAGQCIPYWRHLAVGDHIPETVEHGRGHVQRLLELAQQLFVALDLQLTDEQYFVFISSVWLHDLGHSGNHFTFEGQDGLVINNDEPASKTKFFVNDDPDKVRLYHNFLSYELINTEKLFLFPEVDEKLDDFDKLHRSIGLACLYHRNRMPVTGSDPKEIKETVCKVSKSVEDFGTDPVVIKDFPLVAALLRFLDGAENQQERTGSGACREVTDWVIKRQVASIEQDPVFENEEWLQRICRFKKNQPEHFEKHSMIKNVFLTSMEGQQDHLKPDGIFGSGDHPVVGAYLIGNVSLGHYDRQKVLDKIAADLLGEFQSVQSILPFDLAIFLAEQIPGNTNFIVSQLVNTSGEKPCWLKLFHGSA
jgi:CRISPR/Cas system-associated protein Csm6